jgi:pyruvate formate lyase activating enzyme
MQSGLIFNIQRYCVQDGPGIRTTVFLKGCPLRCWWCHNPESQPTEPEIVLLEARCTHCGECRTACPKGGGDGHWQTAFAEQCTRCGACVTACPSHARQMIGRRMTVDEVLAEVLKDRIFYEDSGGGATFSGGEPLYQPHFLRGLLEACRSRGIHTALDTSGYAPEADVLSVAPLVDLFLYDVKIIDDARHREYTGVSNRTIIENLKALGRVHQNIWIRMPVIPGFNDNAEQLEAAAQLAAAVPGVRQLSLLSYHRLGAHKWAVLGQTRELPTIAPPSAEAIQRIAGDLRKAGVNVQIGG